MRTGVENILRSAVPENRGLKSFTCELPRSTMKAAPGTSAAGHLATARKETQCAARSCDAPRVHQALNSGLSLQNPLVSKCFSKRNPPSTTAAPLSPCPTQPCTSSSGWQVLQTNFHLKPTAEVKSSISLLPLPPTMPFPNPYTSSPRVRAWLGSQMRQLERKGKEQNTLTPTAHTFISHLSATAGSIRDALPAPIPPWVSEPSPRVVGQIPRGAEPPHTLPCSHGHLRTQRRSAQPPACCQRCLRPTGP